MPHLDRLPAPLNSAARGAMILFYCALVVADAVGATWPADGYPYLGPLALTTIRLSGAGVLVMGLVAGAAHIAHRWLTEMQADFPLGLLVLMYGVTLLLNLQPARLGLLTMTLLAAVLAGLAVRGVQLIGLAERRTAVSRGD